MKKKKYIYIFKKKTFKANLSKSCGGHLHPAFVRGVDLQVVAVGAVEAQEPTAGEARIVPWKVSENNIAQGRLGKA